MSVLRVLDKNRCQLQWREASRVVDLSGRWRCQQPERRTRGPRRPSLAQPPALHRSLSVHGSKYVLAKTIIVSENMAKK